MGFVVLIFCLGFVFFIVAFYLFLFFKDVSLVCIPGTAGPGIQGFFFLCYNWATVLHHNLK